MRRWLKLILLSGLALAVLTPPEIVRAQRAAIDQNILLDLLPGLKTAPAPAWLQPGTRITYLSAAASIAAERTKLTEDPNGDWEVTYPDGTKKRFREEDISGTGHGGAGHTVLSVVYLDRSVAVIELRSYASLTYGGPSTLARVGGPSLSRAPAAISGCTRPCWHRRPACNLARNSRFSAWAMLCTASSTG